MLFQKIEAAHIAAAIPVSISYGWPIASEIIESGILANNYFRALVSPRVDSESILSKSTAGDIETLNAVMVVFGKSDKLAYAELKNWLQTIWYETENGNFGKPAVSFKDLGVAPNIVRLRDWHPVGGFDPDYISENGVYPGFAQPVIIEVEQN